jgi:hypothetical protein
MHMNITARKCYKTDKVKALRKGFIITDEKYLGKFEKDGCTAIVALLTEDNHLYVANAGTSVPSKRIQVHNCNRRFQGGIG